MNNMTKAFRPIDVDNIFEATHSPWFFLTPVAREGEYISAFEVEDLEDGRAYMVTAESLRDATEAILAHKHVGKYMTEQCRRDIADWKDMPSYGVPFDAELSDCVIQIACFGEVVYG